MSEPPVVPGRKKCWNPFNNQDANRRSCEPSNRVPVPKLRKDRIREERIHNEIIVDAYGPEEQALGWYYYLENQIQFPFTARCIAAKVVSPLRKTETVEVLRLAPEDSCAHDMLVLIRWRSRNVAVPLSQFTAIDADEATTEAIADWHYWLSQGNCF